MSEQGQAMKKALIATAGAVEPFKALSNIDDQVLYAVINQASELIEADPKWSDLIADDLTGLRKNLSVLNKQSKSLPKVAANVEGYVEEIQGKLSRFGGLS